MAKKKKKSEQEKDTPRGRFHSELFDWGEALLISLTVVILIFVFLVRIIGVSGESMVPTLQDGDQMLVSNIGYTPEKGDIVVLTKDEFLPVPIVKRVIATAGDEIDINFETGEVSVNGEVLDEPYIAEETYTYFDVEFPQTVPEGCIFVLGDNRNNSTDSRYSELGMVDTRYVLGKVLCRIYPIGAFGPVA
ncbi:MAG: signal peptidase I [Eubacteriales bacterium]|nr:signal peptidase I [Eubacteriales bacterium]